jgi:hypothetical protein
VEDEYYMKTFKEFIELEYPELLEEGWKLSC